MKKAPIYITLISATLIVAGYINYYSYYSRFDINITSYITASELILSFVPVLIPLSIALIIIILIAVIKDRQADIEKERDPYLSDKDLSFWGPFKDFRNFAKKRFKADDSILNTWTHHISQLLSRFVVLFIFSGLTLLIAYQYFKESGAGAGASNTITIFIVLFIWIMIIASVASKLFRKNHKFQSIITLVILFLGVLGSIYVYNSFKAFRVLENKPSHMIELKVNGTKIKSDENTVFVGKTSNYIFLRNLKTDQNIIINIDHVETINLISTRQD